MQPSTLIHAITILAKHTGKSVTCDREWLVARVNEIRMAKWKMDSARLLNFKETGCECVECFNAPCPTGCGTTFSGITLPQNVTALHYVQARGIRVDMTNERLPDSGCCSSACGCLKAEILVKKAPLYRDIPDGYKGVIVFKILSDKDKGKRIGVEYVRTDGRIEREDLLASLTGVETKYSPLWFNKVTFPERCGFIEVQTQEGWSLGSYHPSILSPSHLRVRMTGVGKGDLVEWEGLKEPHDVMFDTDQVEWGSEVDWKNDYQFLDLHFKTGKSNAERHAYESSAAFSRAGSDSELKATMPVPSGTLRPKGLQTLRQRIFSLQRR